MKYKVGDKVKIKSVEECRTWFGWNSIGEMDHWCGKTMTIRSICKDGDYKMLEDSNENSNSGWFWEEGWLEPITYFTKDDLKTGMIVKTRSDKIFAVFGGNLLIHDGFEPIDKYSIDLIHKNNHSYDIVKVYDINDKIDSLKKILDQPGKLIWEREPEKREISSEEAFKILKEYYGCDVRIKE